jgi:hypothetical protein
MRNGKRRIALTAGWLVLSLHLVLTAEEPRPTAADWINVLDCGASGSKFETTASTTAGSNEIVVADVGDFKVGQGVMVSRCNIQYRNPRLWGPASPYSSAKPLGDAVEVRGYDGSTGGWFVYLLEIQSADPVTFRWSDDLVKGYKWKATKVPVTYDWQKLSNGIEVKFNKRDLQPGHMITFTARDQLVSTIEKMEGKTITLRDAANRTAKDAVVRHNDTSALQAVIDRAVKEKRNVFFPVGWYRLSTGLRVQAEAIRLEGAGGVDTVMDISDGVGSVFGVNDGTDVTIRSFRMIGHTGYEDRAGSFTTSSGHGFWACALKGCNAVSMKTVERMLIENVHASRMASECFYASGTNRQSTGDQKQMQKSLIYLRCSVTDCAANAFNNNDMGENTSVLYCRVDGAPWHAAEMPTRFLKLVGNYVRNAGPFTVGDMSHRSEDLHNLGCGQAIVVDNVFEGIGQCGGIAVNHGSSQVVIANNLFINYNGPAITASNYTVRTSFPSNTVTITGNIIDMTYDGEKARTRTGIEVSASNVIVSDNQVYVRGRCDSRVTGILIKEPALNVSVHDNLVRNCGVGVKTGRAGSRITEVLDDRTFLENGLPLEWRTSHLYRGWNLVWTGGGWGGARAAPTDVSVIDSFDPDTLRFRLHEPREMKAGDRFEVFPPDSANWTIHDNTVTGCQNPVVLDSYGSETSLFKDNIVTRGDATDVKQAVEVRGSFKLIGNHISGFDEKDSAALMLYPSPLGKACPNLYLNNTFERCSNVVRESQKGLWEASKREGNAFLDCGCAPPRGQNER